MGKHSKTAWETLIAEAEEITGLLKELDPPPSRLLILVKGQVAETVPNPHLLTPEDLRRMGNGLAQHWPKAKRVVLRLEPPPPPPPWDLVWENLPEIVEELEDLGPPFLLCEVDDEALPPFPWATEAGYTAQNWHGGPEEYLKAILGELTARYPTPTRYVGLHAAWPGRNGFHKVELAYFYTDASWMDIVVGKDTIKINLQPGDL